jgi:t-SNARE complex subunit (syntaxin)
MERLEKLLKVLRYAGLNLTPEFLSILLDKNIRNLIDILDEKLKQNPNLSTDAIDEVIREVEEQVRKEEEEFVKKAAKLEKA